MDIIPAAVWIVALLALIGALAALWIAGGTAQKIKPCRICGEHWGSAKRSTCTIPVCPELPS